MGERVGRREIEGKMGVNEGKDGKIKTKGAERKVRQNWKRKPLKEKNKFWKGEEDKEKGWKSKGRKDGKDQSRPQRKVENYGREIGGREGEYQDYIYLLC